MKQGVLALIGVVLGLCGLLLLAGHSPLEAATALVRGAFGSTAGLEASLRRAGPLLFAGLGVAVAFRAGLWNIGGEGQLLLGAVAAAYVGLRLAPHLAAPFAPVLALLCAALAGAAWAALPALLRNFRGIPEVLSTILLNFVALEILGYVVQGPLHEVAGAYPQTDRVPRDYWLPSLVPGSQVHLGLLLGMLLSIGLYALLFHTPLGLDLRLMGNSPGTARHVGIPLRRRVLTAFLLSGGLAGLGGACELLGVTRRLFERFSPGSGFAAIAVALLGRLHPLGILPAAFFFGALEAGAGELQRETGIPSVVVAILQGSVLLLGLFWMRPRS